MFFTVQSTASIYDPTVWVLSLRKLAPLVAPWSLRVTFRKSKLLSAIHVLPDEGGLRLVEIPENPAPLGGRVLALRARDGARLRAALWTPPGARGTVVVLGGRGEFIEKYFEVIEELLSRGFAVAAMDWRGQGGSERALRNPRKGHVDDFALYLRDVQALVEASARAELPKALVWPPPIPWARRSC